MAGQQFGLSVILKLIDQISGPLSRIGGQFNKVGKAWNRNGAGLRNVGKNMSMYVTAPLVGVGFLATKAAVDFESAFTGIVKTVNATAPELETLRTGFLNMAKEIPLSTEELYKIGEAAGQLGIKTQNIMGFSKVMADLGATTNLASGEAATQLARFANITQMSQKDFDRLGSTIVALGNNTATTEAEIVAMSMRLAGAGRVVGISNADIMSLAATMSSLGLEAEAGGTAFSRVLIEMNKAVAKGSKELGVYEQVAKRGGLTGSFKDAFKKDAIGSLQSFIEGMKNLSDNGTNVSLVLDAIGLDGIRTADSLLRASGSGKLLNDTLAIGSQAWKDNNALTREAELRYKTAAAQFQIFKNQLKQMLATFGEVIVPVLIGIMNMLKPMVEWFGKLPMPVKQFIVAFAGLLALIGPLIAFVGIMVGLKAVLAIFGIAVAPILAVAAALTAVGVAIGQIVMNWETLTSGGFLATIKDFGKWMGYLVTGGRAFNPDANQNFASPSFAGVANAQQGVNVKNRSEVVVSVESADNLRSKVKSVKSEGGLASANTSSYAGPMGTPLPAGGY